MAMGVIGSTAFGVSLATQERNGVNKEEALLHSASTAFSNLQPLMKLAQLRDIFAPLAWIQYFASASIRAAIQHRKNNIAYLSNRALEIVNERRQRGTEVGSTIDFVSLMLKAVNKETGEPLRDVQITAHSRTFLLAGYETTANTLAYAVHLLANNPKVEARMLSEIDALMDVDDLAQYEYVEAVVNETLRLCPPVAETARIANNDTIVGGKHIPAGTAVGIPIFAMHRDAKQFPEPSSFKPERFLKDSPEAAARHKYAFMPFGTGPRMCIGYKMALNEVKLTLINLYRKLVFRLPDGAPTELIVRKGITYSPQGGVQVLVQKRAGRN